MIDRERLAELRKTEYNIEGTLDQEILDTIDKLLTVKESAEVANEYGYLKCYCLHGSGCGVCSLIKALAAVKEGV